MFSFVRKCKNNSICTSLRILKNDQLSSLINQRCCFHDHSEPETKPSDMKHGYNKREPPDENRHGFFLHLISKLSFSIDTLAFLHQIPHLDWNKIKEWRKEYKYQKLVEDQRFIKERFQVLGSDLAAAHFIVYRNGAARFKNQENWIRKEKSSYYSLPDKFVSNLYLEAIDASGTDLLYEGLSNFEHLYYLKELNLSGCAHMDDWCMAHLHIFRSTLEHLDISNCPNITERGLCTLHVLRNLKTLNVSDLPSVSDKELVCLLLEDLLPKCSIIGVNYDMDWNVDINTETKKVLVDSSS